MCKTAVILTAISRHADIEIPVPSISFSAYSLPSLPQKTPAHITNTVQNTTFTRGHFVHKGKLHYSIKKSYCCLLQHYFFYSAGVWCLTRLHESKGHNLKGHRQLTNQEIATSSSLIAFKTRRVPTCLSERPCRRGHTFRGQLFDPRNQTRLQLCVVG